MVGNQGIEVNQSWQDRVKGIVHSRNNQGRKGVLAMEGTMIPSAAVEVQAISFKFVAGFGREYQIRGIGKIQ